MKARTWTVAVGLALAVLIVGQIDEAWARARGGGGGSGRGSRSYSAPARPAPAPAAPTTPSSPSRSLNQPAAPSPMAPSRPSFFGGLMGGLAGFALGGLLGSLLFGGFGHGMGFGGIGLMDILLIGGGLALLMMFLRRRRATEPQPAYAGMGGSYREPAEPIPAPTATVTAAPVESDVDRGLRHISSMDGTFDPSTLVSFARDTFFDVQAAVTTRDMSRVRDKVTPELYAELQAQCDQARAAGRTNRVERVDIRRSEISDAWQETGRDYATVYLAGSLIDYTVEDATGTVVAGSATQRDNIEEFWTFTRLVGPGAWRLSAIQS